MEVGAPKRAGWGSGPHLKDPHPGPPPGPPPCRGREFGSHIRRIKEALPTNAKLHLAANHAYRGDDRARIEALAQIARRAGVPLVATNSALYHAPERRPLQDVLTCIREKCTIDEAGLKLEANEERHLKSPEEMARLFAGHEEAIASTVEIADACSFSLDELRYEYPDEPVPAGKTPQSHLEDLTWEGARWRYPSGIPPHVEATLKKELVLIAELDYARYFLTVHDIVHYARHLDILCQGRGSAANSAVCYCLAVTNVDPTEIDLLFERFVSPERKEPPDIDVDFEHERREEVIQYIYGRYGRDRAGIAATVISYRGRSAVREVGKALGLSEDTVAALATTIWGLSNARLPEAYVREAGLDPTDPRIAKCLELTAELIGFPRHLSQHVGGFVLTRGPLSEVVPIGNAAMEDRTFIEWDKDDLDALGLLKVDVLGLGMLTCIRKGFALLKAHYGVDLALGTVPRDDPASLRHAVQGQFSRRIPGGEPGADEHAAALAPALLLRPRHRGGDRAAWADPGRHGSPLSSSPLRHRAGRVPLPASRPRAAGRAAASARQDARRAALPGAGDAARHGGGEILRPRGKRASPRHGHLPPPRHHRPAACEDGRPHDRARLSGGFRRAMLQSDQGLRRIRLPREPRRELRPSRLCLGLAQMPLPGGVRGGAAQLAADGLLRAGADRARCAREHGVEAREVDVNHSLWDCTLEPASPSPNKGEGGDDPRSSPGGGHIAKPIEPDPHPGPPPFRGRDYALRLGLRQIDGLREDDAKTLVSIRDGVAAFLNPHLFAPPVTANSIPPLDGEGGSAEGRAGWGESHGVGEIPPPGAPDKCVRADLPAWGRYGVGGIGTANYRDVRDLWRRSGLTRASLERLAAADSFRSLGLDRRQALWEVRGLPPDIPLPLFEHASASEAGHEATVQLPVMPLSEHVVNDYRTLRLSLKAHPVSFLRDRIAGSGAFACADLRRTRDGARMSVAGVVLVRQRPGSASGVVFMTIEDETGIANAVIWPAVLERYRTVVMGARLVVVHGRIQRHEDIIHVVAERLEDESDWLRLLDEDGEHLSTLVARADHVKHPDGGNSRERAREKKHPRWHPRKHPRAERIIPKSRDFH